eukprot:SAG11_NODE_4037_length_2094_cov_14.631579_1_plen_339_part_10
MSADLQQNPQNKRPATGDGEEPQRDDMSRLLSELIASRATSELALAQQQEQLQAQREELVLLRAQTSALQDIALRGASQADAAPLRSAQQPAAAAGGQPVTTHVIATPQQKPVDLLPADVKLIVDDAVTRVTKLLNRHNNAKTAHDKLVALEVDADPAVPLPKGCPKAMHAISCAALQMPDGMELGTVAAAPASSNAGAAAAGDAQEGAAPQQHMYGDNPLEEMNNMVRKHLRAAQISYLEQLVAIKRSIAADDARAIDAVNAEVAQRTQECLADTVIPDADKRTILFAAGTYFCDARSKVIAKLETKRKEEERRKTLKAKELEEAKLLQLQQDNSSTV